MIYDYSGKKVVAVLAENLSCSNALNVLGHMGIALGSQQLDDLLGRTDLFDRSGTRHAGISRYALIILKTNRAKLRRLIGQARELDCLSIIDFPEQMLLTGHDDELASCLQLASESEITYLGALIFGDAQVINGLTSRFSLWR